MLAYTAFHAPLLLLLSGTSAQDGGQSSDSGDQSLPRSAGTQTSEKAETDDIIVTAKRYGEARVAAETEFGENEIASQGADSIGELVIRLTPFIGNGAEEPILLINGRPADGDRSIRSYPAEALSRVTVLKPEAAGAYGYSSGKRVVNLILKKTFASLDADLGVSAATAGGQAGGSLAVGRVAINGDTRWNLLARVERQSALSRRDRDVAPRVGFFRSDVETDPAFSLVAGETGTIAAGANDVNPSDPSDFETLLPARRNMTFVAGITRALGEFSASFNINASSNGSNGVRALPTTPSTVPVDGRWLPDDDVSLFRSFGHARGLRNDNHSRSLGAAFTMSGRIGDWQTSFSANYARDWTDSLLERGIDTGKMQQRDAGDPAFNPHGLLRTSVLLAERNRSRGENLSARITVSKTIVDLPAGPLTSSYAVNFMRNRSENRRQDSLDDGFVIDERRRWQADGQMSFNVPLARRGEGKIALGDLDVDLSLSGQTLSESGLQKRYTAGVSWSPFSVLQLRGSLDHAETVPSFDQLDGPIVTTVSRIFDFARSETIDVVTTSGGNPNLGRGSRQALSLSAMVRPFDDQTLSLDLGYSAQSANGGIAPFPELTPVIEAAFPERVMRDAAGRLIAVDMRAINIVREANDELTSGIALRLPRQGSAEQQARRVDPLQFSVSLNYSWRLRSELLTHAGIPVIDQLGGGGQSRHLLSLQMTAGKRGVGANLSGNWRSTARVRSNTSAEAQEDFIIKSPVTLNLSAFFQPEYVLPDTERSQWMKDVRFSLDIQNLLNGYRNVILADGTVPTGYSRNEIDPLGRTVRLTVRKRF